MLKNFFACHNFQINGGLRSNLLLREFYPCVFLIVLPKCSICMTVKHHRLLIKIAICRYRISNFFHPILKWMFEAHVFVPYKTLFVRNWEQKRMLEQQRIFTV